MSTKSVTIVSVSPESPQQSWKHRIFYHFTHKKSDNTQRAQVTFPRSHSE